MAVSLNSGEIVNTCEATTGFNDGSLSTDIFLQGAAAVGKKTSETFKPFYTTSLGASAPYNLSTGNEHIVMWFNVLGTPSATQGFQIIVGDGTSRGRWYVPPETGYTGGFRARAIDPAKQFDVIAAGSWTLSGNPGQLTNITQMGGGLDVTSKVTGNFINAMIDQITIGTGLRADGGTTGTPNTFETLRAADESGSKWGWCTSFAGSFILRGGVYLGPATGSATSVFKATNAVVLWASQKVRAGFYAIVPRGSGTTVDFSGCVIRAEDTAVARWSLSVDATIPIFIDNGSLFSGAATITLRSNSVLTDTKLTDCQSLVQNSATLTGCIINSSATADGTAFIVSNDPSTISNCSFTFSDGHAIELTTTGTYSFTGNSFTGYGVDETTDAAIYNNSGGLVTLNLSGGSTPSVRNGAGASTVLNNTVDLTFNGIVSGSRLFIKATAGGPLPVDTEIYNNIVTADPLIEPFNYTGDQPILYRVANASGSPKYKRLQGTGTILSTGFAAFISQELDE
jgi:hypothetical protein